MDYSRRTDMERLDRLARQQTVRLTHYGRKPGKACEVTIWFVVDGERQSPLGPERPENAEREAIDRR